MIDLPFAQTRIEPIHQLIIDAYLHAWRMWRKMLLENSAFGVPLSLTSRANNIHDHVEYFIEGAIGDMPNVDSTKALDFYALRPCPEILLRFKYVQHGLPHNVKTGRQKRLARQEYLEGEVMALNGGEALIAPTLLTAGYTVDGDEIGRIEIRRDCKHHEPWHYDIYGGETVHQPLVLDGLDDTAKPAIVVSTRKKAAENETAAEA